MVVEKKIAFNLPPWPYRFKADLKYKNTIPGAAADNVDSSFVC